MTDPGSRSGRETGVSGPGGHPATVSGHISTRPSHQPAPYRLLTQSPPGGVCHGAGRPVFPRRGDSGRGCGQSWNSNPVLLCVSLI